MTMISLTITIIITDMNPPPPPTITILIIHTNTITTTITIPIISIISSILCSSIINVSGIHICNCNSNAMKIMAPP